MDKPTPWTPPPPFYKHTFITASKMRVVIRCLIVLLLLAWAPAALVSCPSGMYNPRESGYYTDVYPVVSSFCFGQTSSATTWVNGDALCRATFGASSSLAAFRNVYETDYVVSGDCGGPYPYFVGLNDRATEGTWVFSNGADAGFARSMTGNSRYWIPGEPNNGGWGWFSNEDCVTVGTTGQGSVPAWWALMNDGSCDDSRKMCCEVPAIIYSASPTAAPTPPGTPAPTPPGTPAPTVALTPTRYPSTWTPTPIPTAGGAPSFLSYLTGQQYWFLDVWGSNVSEAMYHKR